MMHRVVCVIVYCVLILLSGYIAYSYASGVVTGWIPIAVVMAMVWAGFAGFWTMLFSTAYRGNRNTSRSVLIDNAMARNGDRHDTDTTKPV